MTGSVPVDGQRARPRRRIADIRRTVAVVGVVAALVIVLDYVSFAWFVPWADEMTDNPLMSLGYIVVFFVIFCNLLLFIALLAYLFHGESYPSDRWQ